MPSLSRIALFTLATMSVALTPNLGAAAEEEGFKGRVEASYVKTSGNTDTETLAGKLKGGYASGANRYLLQGSAFYTETDGTETSNRWTLDGRYERSLLENLFGFVEAGYLKDRHAGFTYKTYVGPGIGYDIVKTERHLLKGLASVLYTWEDYSADGADSYATGKLAGDYSWIVSDTVKFRQYADYTAALDDTKVYFVKSDTGLEVKVKANLSLGISYLVLYQSEPPGTAKKTDRTFLTSLILDF